jgi:hypothetical protein
MMQFISKIPYKILPTILGKEKPARLSLPFGIGLAGIVEIMLAYTIEKEKPAISSGCCRWLRSLTLFDVVL